MNNVFVHFIKISVVTHLQQILKKYSSSKRYFHQLRFLDHLSDHPLIIVQQPSKNYSYTCSG